MDCERWVYATRACDGALGRGWGVRAREPSGQARTGTIWTERSSIDPPRGRLTGGDRRARDAIARPSAATATAYASHQWLLESGGAAATAHTAPAAAPLSHSSLAADDRCTCGVARGVARGERVGWFRVGCVSYGCATRACDGALVWRTLMKPCLAHGGRAPRRELKLARSQHGITVSTARSDRLEGWMA